jgi:hypothetical protein
MSDFSESDKIEGSKPDSSSSTESDSNKEQNSIHADEDASASAMSITPKKTTPNANPYTAAPNMKAPEDEGSVRCYPNTDIVDSTKNDKDTTVDTRPKSLELIPHTIHLYTLRKSKENSGFIIQAIFDGGIKLNFTRYEALSGENDIRPFVHYLALNLMRTDDGQLYVMHQGRLQAMCEYYLRISLRIFNHKTHYVDRRRRLLSNHAHTSHQFLFDVDFNDQLITSAPGKFNMM